MALRSCALPTLIVLEVLVHRGRVFCTKGDREAQLRTTAGPILHSMKVRKAVTILEGVTDLTRRSQDCCYRKGQEGIVLKLS